MTRHDQTCEPRVSVIVPVFRDAETLGACCSALLTQSYAQHLVEIIVVNNDPAADLVVAPAPRLRTLLQRLPGSYAARNVGIQHSLADIVAFTDADCVPSRDWIREGVSALEHSGQRSIIGGRIVARNDDPSNETTVELYQRLYSLDQRKYVEKEGFAATANLFAWRRVFCDVGPFDDTLLSGGDAEWGERARMSGYVLSYSESAVVVHSPRRTLWRLLRRTQRVTGGEFGRLRRTTPTDAAGIAAASGIGMTLRQLPGTMNAIIEDSRVRRLGTKLGLLAVATAKAFQQVAEFARLGLGGSPKR